MKALNAAELCTLEWPRWGLPGGPVVRTPVPWGAGSLPGRETKIPNVSRSRQNFKIFKKKNR